MSSLQHNVSSAPPIKVFWPLMVIGTILAPQITPVGLIYLTSQSTMDRIPLLIAISLAGLLTGLPCWWLYIVRPRQATIRRGVLGGMLSAIIAHFIGGILFALLMLLMGTNALDHRTVLETIQDAIGEALFALFLFGWITIPIGGAAGALLIYLQHVVTRWAHRWDIPFSKLAGHRHIGADFFQRINAVQDISNPPQGLVDDLSEFRSMHFQPETIHPAIRTFYEETELFSLSVRAQWKSGFRFVAHIYRFFSSRIGQLNFPVGVSSDTDFLESHILPINQTMDGRTGVRAWIRTYKETEEAMYVAAYANHSTEGLKFINIAFPMPGGNITCILRLESMQGGHVLLTTIPLPNTMKYEGVYFVNRFLPMRLPAQETIRVWAVGKPGIPADLESWSGTATLLARHDVRLFGIKLLTLDYRIFAL
jgi:hypothetical protein